VFADKAFIAEVQQLKHKLKVVGKHKRLVDRRRAGIHQ